MPCRALTLLELLVAAVIIAVLAAIALPGLLAAQTRAKVSRARADIHTIVTAVEVYRVDWSGYPTHHCVEVEGAGVEFHVGGALTPLCAPDPSWDGYNPLTTPIAYLVSMPRDPFARPPGDVPSERREYLYAHWRCAVEMTRGTWWEPHFAGIAQSRGPYSLHSRGPDGDGGDGEWSYDPTNGIGSDGDIIYDPRNGFDRLVPCPWRESL
ncbi:type II secretion system protein GspG [Candidatus Sumerlaeota bacterium]|nr:type II secretion system protein GspG [Candidatus Sumerlaeota bacterium]